MIFLAMCRARLRKGRVLVCGMQASIFTGLECSILCFHFSIGSPKMVPSIMEGQGERSLGSKTGRRPLELQQKALWLYRSPGRSNSACQVDMRPLRGRTGVLNDPCAACILVPPSVAGQHLGAHQKCRVSGPTKDLLNQTLLFNKMPQMSYMQK